MCVSSLLLAAACGGGETDSRPSTDGLGRSATWRRIQGEDSLEQASAVRGTLAYDLGRSIARVENTADGYGYCSAIRVGERLFLTNQHCARRCDRMRFRLGYEDDRPESYQATFLCQWLIVASEPLDYALYRVQAETAAPLADFPAAVLARGMPYSYQPVILASYPSADESTGQHRFKEFDRSRECRIGSAEVFTSGSGRRSIEHYCDSDVGSSGAALFDPATGRAVALHWGGTTDAYNMAIPMGLIVEDLQRHVEPSLLDELTIAP